MKRLYGTIDLTAIGRIVRSHPELVQEVMFKDGAHKMLRIDVHAKKEVDQYGNVAFIKATCKKEEQREGVSYYISNLKGLHEDEHEPLLTHNLVYLESTSGSGEIDRDILYSILDKDSKRAQAYWFVSVQVLNEPDTMYYDVETYGTDFIYRIRLSLGFKCSPLVNVYLRQIVQDLQADGTLPRQEKKYSIYGPSSVGTFKFCMIHKTVPAKTELSSLDEFILHSKYFIRRLAGSKMRWYGLDTSSMIVERVPLITGVQNARRIQRNIKS